MGVLYVLEERLVRGESGAALLPQTLDVAAGGQRSVAFEQAAGWVDGESDGVLRCDVAAGRGRSFGTGLLHFFLSDAVADVSD